MEEKLFRDMFKDVPEIEYSTGYRYFLGNMENYSQAILSTFKSMRSKIPILYSMYQSKEYAGLRTITQTLRRMFGTVGATGLADLSFQLETVYLNREDDELQDMLDGYINALYEFSGNLEDLLRKLNLRGLGSGKEDAVSFGSYDFTKTKESIRLSTDFLERKII